MQLTAEDIEEFQRLYERKFGKRLERAEAHAKAASLIRIFQLIYRPLTEAEQKHLPIN